MSISTGNPASDVRTEPGVLEPFGGVLDHWRARRGAATMPSRAAVDPVALPRHAISRLALFEVAVGAGFRCRLSGETLITALGRNPKGTLVEAAGPDEGAWRALARLFGAATGARSAVLGSGKVGGRLIRVLALPLSDDGEVADAVLACFAFDPAPSGAGDVPWMRGDYVEIGRVALD